MTPRTAVAWFRRDLRVHDHPALVRAVEDFDRVAPLFVVDERLVAGGAAVGGKASGGRASGLALSPNRTWFMGRSVAVLAGVLGGLGADLSILRGDPVEVVPRFAREIGATAVLVSRDYAPYGRRRDDAVARACAALGIAFIAEPGILVHEPESVRRADGGSFSVFSPFHRAWETLERRPVLSAPDRIPGPRLPRGPAGSIDAALGDVRPTADPDLLPAPGEAAARTRLVAWSRSPAAAAYATDRERLDGSGTSHLSQDLRWGLVSPVEVLATVEDAAAARPTADGPSPAARGPLATAGTARLRTEIAWRDFYAHLLWDRPALARHSLRPGFDESGWHGDDRLAEAWREGRTGVPVVDAAMRQLRATGWMSNRARMIVASFLTKQLGVDWRVGAAHFMEHLVDGDVASNSGGWQWAASTGTDAQPWFRVFNPILQGQRFDPDGSYVRRWVPELAARPDLPGGRVHAPPPAAYVPPIVDLAEARRRALEFHRSVRDRLRAERPVEPSPGSVGSSPP